MNKLNVIGHFHLLICNSVSNNGAGNRFARLCFGHESSLRFISTKLGRNQNSTCCSRKMFAQQKKRSSCRVGLSLDEVYDLNDEWLQSNQISADILNIGGHSLAWKLVHQLPVELCNSPWHCTVLCPARVVSI